VADLPHHEHVERDAKRPGHARRDRDTAARNGEDDRTAAGAVSSHGGRTGASRNSFGITGLIPQDLSQGRTKQHPRLGAVPEGGRT